ncbi:MAG: pilin [Gammaproteobacteria bacterium]
MSVQRKQEGFTLIELMIVVAIIAILAAIAIPLYLNYTTRAQGTEALSLAGGLKPAVSEWYNTQGSFTNLPTNTGGANNALGVDQASKITGKYVKSVTVKHVGATEADITAAYCTNPSTNNGVACAASSKLANHSVTLAAMTQAAGSNTSITWVCFVDNASVYPLVPTNCRYTTATTALAGSH